jgi:hypothetical protein
MRPSVLLSALAVILVVTAVGGCGSTLSLNPAVIENRVDTVVVWAANGTPIFRPSGYSIAARTTVRLDQGGNFDFIYRIDAAGRPVFLPLAAIAATGRTIGNPGFQVSTTRFDDITVGQQLNYVTNDTVHIAAGEVFFARSEVSSACTLGIPYYAKLEILAFDDTERAVTFRILSNINCGYRGLTIGLPTQ